MNFIFKRINFLTLLSLLFFVNQSCNKNSITSDTNGNTRGGIALTFDDNYIDNWYPNLDLFDSLGVKATFYISNYNKLTVAQKNKLREIRDHGHEIAFHSTNHVNFLKCADSSGVEKMIRVEISHGLRLMNNDGFYPTTFAYPYGKHNDMLDKLLLLLLLLNPLLGLGLLFLLFVTDFLCHDKMFFSFKIIFIIS